MISKRIRVQDEAQSLNILQFNSFNMSQMCTQCCWEGFTSDIITLVQTDIGIPWMNRQPYNYVVPCRTLLSLLKPFVTEERINLLEVWKSKLSKPEN